MDSELKRLTASEMQIEQGLTRLARMAATQSLKRNLTTEDDAVRRETESHQAEVWGDKAMEKPSDDEMDIMAARDVVVRYENPQSPQPPPKGTNPLAVAALTAAGLIGAGSVGMLLANYFRQPTTAVQPGQVFGVDVKDGLPE